MIADRMIEQGTLTTQDGRTAVEVRIPTILRTYTGGEKAVQANGATLAALIEDLEANHPGIKDRLIEASEQE